MHKELSDISQLKNFKIHRVIWTEGQWRVQDFAEVDAPTLQGAPKFPKNFMKFGPQGGGGAFKILLCRSATLGGWACFAVCFIDYCRGFNLYFLHLLDDLVAPSLSWVCEMLVSVEYSSILDVNAYFNITIFPRDGGT